MSKEGGGFRSGEWKKAPRGEGEKDGRRERES